jgi:hypothetical protein
MAKPFKGKIELDIRDSTPDWQPFLPDKAPPGAPNVLVILYDDTGLAACSPFGGRIQMPTLQRLADRAMGEHHEAHGPLKLYVDDQVIAEREIRTMASRYSLCGEGMCVGYDGGDAVSREYKPKFEFTGGTIVKVLFDVADDAYVNVERHLAAAIARD